MRICWVYTHAQNFTHARKVQSSAKMAEMWEQLRSSVRDILPPDVAEYEAEVIAATVVTSLLAFLGEEKCQVQAFQNYPAFRSACT